MPIYAIYDYENISGDPDEELKRPLRVIDPLEIGDMLHAHDLRAMVENSWPGVFFYLDDDGGIRAKTSEPGCAHFTFINAESEAEAAAAYAKLHGLPDAA
jgi:hypothetical protein